MKKKLIKDSWDLRFFIIYGLEILMALVGAAMICIFAVKPEPWILIAGLVASALSVVIDRRNDGWVKKGEYKTSDYHKSED